MDYVIAPIAFKTVNAQNVGDYYTGLAVDAAVSDGLSKNWRHTQENCLATTLNYIQAGSFTVASNARLSAEQVTMNQTLDKKMVKNTVVRR